MLRSSSKASFQPMPVEKQVAILYCGTKGLLMDVPKDRVREFEKEYLETYWSIKNQKILESLRKGDLSDEVTASLEKIAKEVAAKYKY